MLRIFDVLGLSRGDGRAFGYCSQEVHSAWRMGWCGCSWRGCSFGIRSARFSSVWISWMVKSFLLNLTVMKERVVRLLLINMSIKKLNSINPARCSLLPSIHFEALLKMFNLHSALCSNRKITYTWGRVASFA